MKRLDIYDLIDKERERQEGMFGARSIAGDLPLDTKLRILVEEVGEVAQAIDSVESFKRVPNAEDGYTHDDALDHLQAELVQVAACAVGMLEALDNLAVGACYCDAPEIQTTCPAHGTTRAERGEG